MIVLRMARGVQQGGDAKSTLVSISHEADRARQEGSCHPRRYRQLEGERLSRKGGAPRSGCGRFENLPPEGGRTRCSRRTR